MVLCMAHLSARPACQGRALHLLEAFNASLPKLTPHRGCCPAGSSNPTEVLTKEMEKLMESLEPGTKKDLAAMKEKVFGPQVFWVTDTRPDLGRSPGAYLVSAAELRAAKPKPNGV